MDLLYRMFKKVPRKISVILHLERDVMQTSFQSGFFPKYHLCSNCVGDNFYQNLEMHLSSLIMYDQIYHCGLHCISGFYKLNF